MLAGKMFPYRIKLGVLQSHHIMKCLERGVKLNIFRTKLKWFFLPEEFQFRWFSIVEKPLDSFSMP